MTSGWEGHIVSSLNATHMHTEITTHTLSRHIIYTHTHSPIHSPVLAEPSALRAPAELLLLLVAEEPAVRLILGVPRHLGVTHTCGTGSSRAAAGGGGQCMSLGCGVESGKETVS
jgi:hypothetical protein